MFSISLIFEVSEIIKTLVFSEQLSIIYLFPLQLKYFPSFINYNTFALEFWDIKLIIPQSELERREKELLLLDNRKKT